MTELVLFHGTNQPIVRFDPARLSASTSSASSKVGYWFTDDPAVASDYANKAARTVVSESALRELEIERLAAAMRNAERRVDWGLAERLTEQLEAHELGGMLEGAVGQNVIPVCLRLLDPFWIDVQRAAQSTGRTADSIERAKASDHDGVVCLNTTDTDSRVPSNLYVDFRPDQIIRSRASSGTVDCS